MSKRIISVICLMALLASACGSRVDSDESTPATDATPDPTVAPDGDGALMVGDLEVPCNDGPPPPAPDGTPGVTDTGIRLAVISDKAGQVKVPTASIEESMMAFVDLCNDHGGLQGRQIELVPIDSQLFQHLEATQQACNSNVFAVVGSGSVTDNTGAQALLDCGLIEVAAYAATAAKAMSDDVFSPVPNPINQYNTGPGEYMVEEHPEAVKKAAMLVSDIATATVHADRMVEAYEQIGFEFIYNERSAVVQESYTAQVIAMRDAGVEYVTMVSAVSETNKMLRDMRTQGFEPEVLDLGQQYYDPEMLTEPGSEGAYVFLNTVAFEDVDDSPALRTYLDAYEQVGSPIQPTSLGIQSFSAALLFATAAAQVDELTRENVITALGTIDSWTGGGLHYEANPAGNAVGECFAYFRVQDGEFVRLEPAEPGGFDCPGATVTLSGDYGQGAQRP